METAEQTMARANDMLKAPTPSTGTPTTPTKTATGVITPESMTTTPVINVPTPPVPTEAPALMAQMGVQAEDAFTRQQTEAKKAAETTQKSAASSAVGAKINTLGAPGDFALPEDRARCNNGNK